MYKITQCVECEHCYERGISEAKYLAIYYCVHPHVGKKETEVQPIPEWCPMKFNETSELNKKLKTGRKIIKKYRKTRENLTKSEEKERKNSKN